MQPGAVREPGVDHRARVVQPLTTGGGEAHRERAQPLGVAQVNLPALEAPAAVQPDLAGPVDQHVA